MAKKIFGGNFLKKVRVRNRAKDRCRDKRNREFIDSLKKKGCEVCGYNKSLLALCFHHIDQGQKRYELGSFKYSYSLKSIQEEVNKCILVCANCHAEIHEKEGFLISKGVKVTVEIPQMSLFHFD